jgi:hypothetical protein
MTPSEAPTMLSASMAIAQLPQQQPFVDIVHSFSTVALRCK